MFPVEQFASGKVNADLRSPMSVERAETDMRERRSAFSHVRLGPLDGHR